MQGMERPKNLAALEARKERFADFETGVLDDFLPAWNGDHAEALSRFPSTALFFFGRDGSGGHLAIARPHGEPIDEAPVVLFGSEGGLEILGASFDDFLRLVASRFEDQFLEHLGGDKDYRRWLKEELGLSPYERPEAHLAELATQVPAIAKWFWSIVREIERDTSVVEVVPGVSVGPIALGCELETLVPVLGEPLKPRFHATAALFPGTPYFVELSGSTVEKVTLFSGPTVLRIEGFEALWATEAELTAFLAKHAPSARATRTEIVAPELWATFTITRAFGKLHGWVGAVSFTRRDPPR